MLARMCDSIGYARATPVSQSNDLPRPESPVEADVLQEALDRVVRASLQPVTAALSGLFFFFALNHALVLPRSIAIPMIIVALGTATTLLLARIVLGRYRLPSRWAQASGAAISSLVLGNSLLQLALSHEPRQSTNIALVIVGSGSLLLSWGWLLLIITLSLGGWSAIVLTSWNMASGAEWLHFGFMLLSATMLALLIHSTRRRTMLRLERLRLLDAERQRDLEAALIEAQSANQAKSTFLATMSHEFRTPLNAIMGMTNLLLDTELSPDQRELTDVVVTSSQQLLGIVTHILQMTQLEAGQVIIETIEFHTRESLTIAVETVRPHAEARGLRVLTFIDPALPGLVQGDPLQLHQVLLNLLDNAVKFTERGEVMASVAVLESSEKYVTLRFAVRDTGIGISPEAQSHIFEPFTQADQTTTRNHGGTGLGLAISKRIVELMGGRIGFESTPKQGSTFWFELPLRLVPEDF